MPQKSTKKCKLKPFHFLLPHFRLNDIFKSLQKIIASSKILLPLGPISSPLHACVFSLFPFHLFICLHSTVTSPLNQMLPIRIYYYTCILPPHLCLISIQRKWKEAGDGGTRRNEAGDEEVIFKSTISLSLSHPLAARFPHSTLLNRNILDASFFFHVSFLHRFLLPPIKMSR